MAEEILTSITISILINFASYNSKNNRDMKKFAFIILFASSPFINAVFAQEVTESFIYKDELEKIDLNMEGVNINTIIQNNKSVLRKAARLSKGSRDRFMELLMVNDFATDRIQLLNRKQLDRLYKESYLLTLSGKVEALPSIL